jgi:cleavage stimulation factor subunit 3
MADDGELAFLNAQKEYDPSTTYEAAGEEEYDPANTYSADVPSERSASMPESAGNTPPPGADGEGESGLEPQPAPVSAEVSAAPTPSKQPRTRGGFVDESEDEEEEPVEQPKTAASALLNASGAAESPQRSFTNTPNNTLPTPDVQLHSAQDQGALSLLSASVAVNESAPSLASTLPNGSTPIPDVAMTGAPDLLNVASGRQSTAPVTPVPTSNALPKARLPQDRIGILEDRIAEDPRGDIEAWLSLIDEHRRRHKNDEARAAFERFLKIFPTAVSNVVDVSYNLANMCLG